MKKVQNLQKTTNKIETKVNIDGNGKFNKKDININNKNSTNKKYILNNGEKNVGDLIDNKNNESKDESFELEENKENERLFQEFISCPKTRVFIYFSLISFFTFNFIDAILIAFRLFKDNNGEELYIN